MKIEKKKVIKSSKLNHFAKSAVAAALGIAASFGTTACDDSVSAIGGDNKAQEPQPTCGKVACGEQHSSSSYTDISSSGEHLSSEAIEALSSASQPRSSSSIEPLSGTPMIISSSSVEKPSSSSMEQPPEAGILPPYEESSSSVAPSSSSMEILEPLAGDPIIQESSSSESTPDAQSSSSDIKVPVPQITPVIDTLNPRIHLCEDPFDNSPRCNVDLCKDPDGCLIFSMVTTFEQDDIQA